MSRIVTMDEIVRAVLAVGNKEQNQHWPPSIISDGFNTLTAFLIDRCVELFPGNNSIVSVIKPFMVKEQIPVTGGLIAFPDGYRNILGAAITVNKDKTTLCGGSSYHNDPLAPTQAQLDRLKSKGDCVSNAVNMVDIDEWDSKTNSLYKKPTYKKPIGCIFEGDGIKVCPYDIPSVELRYVREPKIYSYGYSELPDHTFIFDPATTVESEWEHTAYQYLFKGMSSMYAALIRDNDLKNWNTELKNIGLL